MTAFVETTGGRIELSLETVGWLQNQILDDYRLAGTRDELGRGLVGFDMEFPADEHDALCGALDQHVGSPPPDRPDVARELRALREAACGAIDSP
jgi:hypothetical protein